MKLKYYVQLKYYFLLLLLVICVSCFFIVENIDQKNNFATSTLNYFDDTIKIEDFDYANILIDEKYFENVLVCDISYKTLIGARTNVY